MNSSRWRRNFRSPTWIARAWNGFAKSSTTAYPATQAASKMAYEEAGVQHMMVHPENREVDDWNTVIAGVGRVAAG